MRKAKVESNSVRLVGEIITGLEVSHRTERNQFYKCTLQVARTSGTCDIIPIVIKDRIIEQLGYDLKEGARVLVEGIVRTHNEYGEDNRIHLKVYVQVLDITAVDQSAPSENVVFLTGNLCSVPNFRITPLKREITDFTLANNLVGKMASAYIPCIAWGETARKVACMKRGEEISIKGRFQSREYTKTFPDGTVKTKTAYEISISELV